jgi:uncharacterized protein
MRVLLDTNILISYLLTPVSPDPNSTINKIVEDAVLEKFQLLLPDELLDELIKTVRTHRHLAQKINPEDLNSFLKLITEISQVIPQIKQPIPTLTRDPKDDFLIAYALVGSAEYLVTGDKDLLTLKKIEGVEIVNPKEFASRCL